MTRPTMTRPQFFIISSAIIFILERVLQPLFSFPVFIFPVFVVLFGLLSAGDILAYFSYVAVAALFFDFFSGLHFGWLTIAILAVSLTMYLAWSFLNINGRSPIFTFAFSLIFIFEYFLLLAIRMPQTVILQAPIILAEAAILLTLMTIIFSGVKFIANAK